MFESSKLTHFYSHHPSKFCPFGLCFLFRRLFGRLPRVVLRLSWDCGWYLRLCAPVESDNRIYSVLKLLHQHMSVKSLRKALLLYGGINFWERGENSAKASAYVWLCLRGWKGVDQHKTVIERIYLLGSFCSHTWTEWISFSDGHMLPWAVRLKSPFQVKQYI